MKQLIAILAFVGILMQTYSKVMVYTAFYLNRNYIAKSLCENRNKPGMKCCGKCYLKKKLANQEKQDQLPTSRNSKDKQIELFYSYTKPEVVHFSFPENASRYFSHNELLTISVSHTVFRPPTA
ncbi:MAG TPA: hypothetical protein VN721_07015 [Flavipsychrobacter sp.]|nr:hypothetical protein [Flavipsychrobacter sp.]